jgi:site-specific recombinase XerC
LRHTAASIAIASSADVNVIQTMLGHKSATLTLDVYGHLFPGRLDEVSKKMHKRRAIILAKAQAKASKAKHKAQTAALELAELREAGERPKADEPVASNIVLSSMSDHIRIVSGGG